ncbi:MAG TPA: serine/threonine-protein kinase [Gemmatimonadaceae bacterium]
MPVTDQLQSALADRYRIERELGSGGMATVYLARDLKHDRDVAVKVLRSDLSAVIGTERFLAEVRITARLDHPHILTLIDSGEAAGILYYVLPYVRGESLRARLDREKQLGIDEAVSITRQVASALDYAHSHGVVHRDIKPENVLLHEGEAVLADFGIALAVKEAGGNRLTETGLSLGTPQYMSPEQATGDRALDKRSDIYSLAAVFYEMIGGEPPVTGGTAQAMIAKLLTEKPVKLKVLRDTVPVEIEYATEKALSKVPADRYSSAGDFARALSQAPASHTTRSRSNRKVLLGIAAVFVLVAGALIAHFTRHEDTASTSVSLRDKKPLTRTGNAFVATMSDDGKAFAYTTTVCTDAGCRYAIELSDIDGSGKRRVLENATAVYRTEISPDRRNLLMLGSIEGQYGSWIVSLVGGAPRYISPAIVSFYAGGDSLLIARIPKPDDKSFWIVIAALDGVPGDSIEIRNQSDRPPMAAAIPGSTGIVVSHGDRGTVKTTVVDRSGAVISELALAPGDTGGTSASSDAVWFYINPQGADRSIMVRVPFMPGSIKLSSTRDTVFTGTSTSMSVNGDGSLLMYDEGSTDYSAWLVPISDLAANRFSENNRLERATGELRGAVSPDGKMILVGRQDGEGGRKLVVYRPESSTPIEVPGSHGTGAPLDSNTIKISDRTDTATTMYLYDVVTRRKFAERKINEVGLPDLTRVGNAWAWIPSSGAYIMIQGDNDSRARRINLPKWYGNVFWISGAPNGDIAFLGFAESGDSLGAGIIARDGSYTEIAKSLGEGGGTSWMNDGSLVVAINDTPESETLWHWKKGHPLRRLASTQRLISTNTTATLSGDMSKVFVVTFDDRRDVWLTRVVK